MGPEMNSKTPDRVLNCGMAQSIVIDPVCMSHSPILPPCQPSPLSDDGHSNVQAEILQAELSRPFPQLGTHVVPWPPVVGLEMQHSETCRGYEQV